MHLTVHRPKCFRDRKKYKLIRKYRRHVQCAYMKPNLGFSTHILPLLMSDEIKLQTQLVYVWLARGRRRRSKRCDVSETDWFDIRQHSSEYVRGIHCLPMSQSVSLSVSQSPVPKEKAPRFCYTCKAPAEHDYYRVVNCRINHLLLLPRSKQLTFLCMN